MGTCEPPQLQGAALRPTRSFWPRASGQLDLLGDEPSFVQARLETDPWSGTTNIVLFQVSHTQASCAAYALVVRRVKSVAAWALQVTSWQGLTLPLSICPAESLPCTCPTSGRCDHSPLQANLQLLEGANLPEQRQQWRAQ